MKIMTFNVLCAEEKHGITRKSRVPLVCDTIKKHMPDSLGIQEAQLEWMDDLCDNLPMYDFVGVGRDDGKKDGEFSPIFYLRDKFNVKDSGNFWLSETPDEPSLGWDAHCKRICSWAVLEEKETGKAYIHMNTHLDHRGWTAREKGLELMLERSKKFSLPTVVTGDFNFFEGCDLYKKLTESMFNDTKYLTDDRNDTNTFNGFDMVEEYKKDLGVIDFILVTPQVKATKYRVFNEKVDGQFSSDHYPVYAEIEL